MQSDPAGTRRTTALVCLTLFALALGLRELHEHESRVDNPLRGDAGKYFAAAYNLRFYGAHSLEDWPGRAAVLALREDGPPTTRTDLSPGYPLFLAPFLAEGKSVWDVLGQVLHAQAWLGALTALLTFALARLALPLWPAFAAGVLVAASPHLIAMDGLLLTESLFIFLLAAGLYAVARGWQTDRSGWTAAGGLLLALSSQVRTVSLLLPLFLLPGFARASGERERWRPRRRVLYHALATGLAMLGVEAAHRGFQAIAVTSETTEAAPSEFRDLSNPLAYVTNLVPPRFYVAGQSHVYEAHHDPTWKQPTDLPFRDAPGSYLAWNLGGKLWTMLHWDNAYAGDIYTYPMERAGFEANTALRALHRTMRALHPALVVLALIGITLAAFRTARAGPAPQAGVIIAAATALYFLLALSFVSWLPRYTIPLRPALAVLAVATGVEAADRLRRRRGAGKD